MNIRRSTLVAAAAVALILAPSAAQAYGADDYSNKGAISDSTPVVGELVTVTLRGPANADVLLTVSSPSVADSDISIAGSKTFTKKADAAGNVSFAVRIAAGGTYTLLATDAATGVTISSQTISVAAAAGAGGQLSATGSNTLPIALGAGALVLLGAGGVVVARRRGAMQAA